MDERTLLTHLHRAEAAVKKGERHIVKQLRIIANLAHRGIDTAAPEALLRLFVELQVEHERHRDHLKQILCDRGLGL